MNAPGRTGVWIGDGGSPALVIFFAMALGWDGGIGGERVFSVAQREIAGKATPDEADELAFQWNLEAEDWMNANRAAEGYQFGWKGGEFRYETDEWWEATPNHGPDKMWLP